MTVLTLSGPQLGDDGVSREAFLDAMAELPAGVTVVTAWDAAGRPAGATVSSVTSLSLEPPMLLVCLSRSSETCRSLRRGSRFLVHVLAEGQEALATRFASKGRDKFAEIDWEEGLLGLPQLTGCAVVAACEAVRFVAGGDHVIVLGGMRRLVVRDGADPLVYHRRRLNSSARLGDTRWNA